MTRTATAAAACLLVSAGCASSVRHAALETPGIGVTARDERRTLERWSHVEEEALEWIAAADPRLFVRAGVNPSETVLERIGKDAMVSEDADARLVGSSLDLFAFHARERALQAARDVVTGFGQPMPDRDVPSADASSRPGAVLDRPRLERELLVRLIDEERARAADEAQLGDASGALVRAILATWTPLAAPQEGADRDQWVSRRLLEIRDSLRAAGPHAGPIDLDAPLYPLERLLAPLQFPKGAAAIAEVRLALDADTRPVPPLVDSAHLAAVARIHLGLALDGAAATVRLERVAPRVRALAERALEDLPPGRERVAALARGSALLFVEGPCPSTTGSRVRAMAPPPERAMACGALRALAEEAVPAAALVALHDDVLLALAALTTSPPPRTRLLSTAESDRVDSLRTMARERPVPALGAALVADILCSRGDFAERLQAWRALGEVPLDVAENELDRARP